MRGDHHAHVVLVEQRVRRHAVSLLRHEPRDIRGTWNTGEKWLNCYQDLKKKKENSSVYTKT